MKKPAKKPVNPWAALEGRLLGICTQLERAKRLVPENNQDLVPHMDQAIDQVQGIFNAVSNLRINHHNEQTIANLARFRKMVKEVFDGREV